MYFDPFPFCRVLSRMHESMTDLRKLVAETQAQRPKTEIGGIVDSFDPKTDDREGQGTCNMAKLLLLFSILMNCCRCDNVSQNMSEGAPEMGEGRISSVCNKP